MVRQIKYTVEHIICFLLFFILFFFIPDMVCVGQNVPAKSVLIKGLEAYKNGDWTSAIFLLRQSLSLKEDDSPETLYMLIMSELYSAEYKSALSDCDVYISRYPESCYISYVEYEKGRTAYYLGDYNRAVLLLSDFCHRYPGHEMYVSALFWMAEAFYAGYNYDQAKALYERIVTDFPLDAKAAEAQYRIETVEQRRREEKLIYLLKMTGEEYLSAKEEYEKQLKTYKTEGLVGLQRELKTEQDKSSALAAALEEQKKKNAELQSTVDSLQTASAGIRQQEPPEKNSDILELKKKAREIQSLMNSNAEE